MSTLLLIRHAQSEANAQGVLAGRLPGYPLSDLGREQASGLAERLESVPLKVLYTSPIQRCQETAEQIAAPHGLVPVVEDQLTECDYGEWSGHKLTDLTDKPEWSTVQRVPSEAGFPGGERLKGMSDRAVDTVQRLRRAVTEAHGQQAVWGLCSHGDVIKSVIAHFTGVHFDLFQRLAISTASVSILTWHGDSPSLRLFNDTGSNYPDVSEESGDPKTAPTVGGETD